MTSRDGSTVSLYSLASWTNGLAFKADDFSTTGLPIIKIAEVKGGVTEQTKRTSSVFDEKYRVVPGDMIFCWSGQPETSIGTFYWSGPQGWLNQHLFKVSPNESVVDKQYFFYLLRSLQPVFVELARNKQTTGLGHVTKRNLIDLHVQLPSMETQRRVAAVLSPLDALIDLNESLIRQLDELFHAEWLKRFSDVTGEGEVPVSTLVTTQYGYTDAATDDPAGPHFLRVADINKQNWVDWASVPYCSPEARKGGKYRLRKGDVVVARMADPGQSARVDSDVDAVFASYLVRVAPIDPGLGLFLFGYFKSKAYRQYSEGAMTGSVQRNMNAKIITGSSIRVPTSESLKKWNAVSEPLREAMAELLNEARQLRGVRDEVLPLLLNGRLRVRHAVAMP